MVRKVLGVVAGYLVWTVVFLGGGAGIRAGMPGVHDADGYTDSLTALLLYLLLSFLASLLAGFVAGRLAGALRPVWVLAVLLLATGIPVQWSAGARIPLWYDLVFLAMLIPLTIAGGRRGTPAGA